MPDVAIEKTLKEIVRLFNEAQATLSTTHDRVTAKTCFNRAQSMLDELERHPAPQVRALVKQARAEVRALVKNERSLTRKLEIYSAFWSQKMRS